MAAPQSCSLPPERQFGVGLYWATLGVAMLLALLPFTVMIGVPRLLGWVGRSVGFYLKRKTAGRRIQILERVEGEEKSLLEQEKGRRDSDDGWENVEAYAAGTAQNGERADKEWEGIVGFFHPFCNAGGGGERVLWAAIRATQKRWPNAKCIVYTGDHDVDKRQILTRVENRFNIHLHPPTITFLYLTSRHWVLASTWPHFTLLGQSLGSLVLAYDAFSLLAPDIFIDTMGYAFALGLSKVLFPDVPTGAYVHYPTISTDMLESLEGTQGVNAGRGAGLPGKAKKLYWELFAKLYCHVGATVDVVMTNSSWTQAHVKSLWGPLRDKARKRSDIAVLYPPVAVEELEQEVEVSDASEKDREKVLLYIAQFRPEKNHQLIINAFAEFLATRTPATKGAKLVLIGSVRDDSDSKRVYELRLLVNELHINESVEFRLDVPWPKILEWLRKASVGVNGMWNEHFGIGVVEYQAAGLISVVHNSGGPKVDIVTAIDGQPTGFHATNSTEFAEGFEKALSLDDPLAMRKRARTSAKRFTEEQFAKGWLVQMEKLVDMQSS
ncbi:MAG: asparagine-linked glycosylation protein [Claussenomyces sp. TS43310]|nr:MAG: asparagine-linked glycosylation protein [Claussenomyces sp. TS43310]